MMALPVVTALLAASAPLNQVDTTAGLRGRAASSFNGRPLAGVMISVPAAHKFIVTDSTGAFWIAGLPPGGQIVRIAYEGRETEEYEFFLRSAHTKTIAVLLDVDAVNLDPLVVEARQANTWRDLAGFYERKRWYGGFARFFTREEIDRIQPNKIGTVLALEGIAVRCYAFCLPTRFSRGHLCVVPVNVNGLPWAEDNYAHIPITSVAAIEIYRGDRKSVVCSSDLLPTRFSRGHLCVVPVNVNGLPWAEDNYDHIPITSVAAIEIYRGEPPYGLSPSLAVTPGSSVWMGGGFPSQNPCGLVLIWTR